jgi:hypothetical protein
MVIKEALCSSVETMPRSGMAAHSDTDEVIATPAMMPGGMRLVLRSAFV